MRAIRRPGTKNWWITDVPPYQWNGETHTEYGPYDTRAEAEAEMRGAERTLTAMARRARKRRPNRAPAVGDGQKATEAEQAQAQNPQRTDSTKPQEGRPEGCKRTQSRQQ